MPAPMSIRINQPTHKLHVMAPALAASGFCFCPEPPTVTVWVDQADGKHRDAATVTVTATATAGVYSWTADFTPGDVVAVSPPEFHSLLARVTPTALTSTNNHLAAVDSVLFSFSVVAPEGGPIQQVV